MRILSHQRNRLSKVYNYRYLKKRYVIAYWLHNNKFSETLQLQNQKKPVV